MCGKYHPSFYSISYKFCSLRRHSLTFEIIVFTYGSNKEQDDITAYRSVTAEKTCYKMSKERKGCTVTCYLFCTIFRMYWLLTSINGIQGISDLSGWCLYRHGWHLMVCGLKVGEKNCYRWS